MGTAVSSARGVRNSSPRTAVSTPSYHHGIGAEVQGLSDPHRARWCRGVPLVAVHAVIDGKIPKITLGKESLGIVADFPMVPAHAGHILENNGFDFSCLSQTDHFGPANHTPERTETTHSMKLTQHNPLQS